MADTPSAKPDTLTRDQVSELIADALKERDAQHAAVLAQARAAFPAAPVPANGGGPGTDNHQASWSLAEQEAAGRGEWLDTWTRP